MTRLPRKSSALLSIYALPFIACSKNNAAPETSTHEDQSAAATADSADIGGSNCSDAPSRLGELIEVELRHHKNDRSYQLYFPEGYDPETPTPLLFNFHGTDGSALGQAAFSQMKEAADRHGVIVVYPEGLPLDGTPVFNAGLRDFTCEPRDDVDFARAILDDVSKQACVNRRKVYSTGMSNGGRMSYRMACDASDWIAAIAPVSGSLSMPTESCTPNRAVPNVHYHGTLDGVAPYDKASGLSLRPVPEMFELWSDWANCDRETRVTFNRGDAVCQTRAACEDNTEVTLCTIEGGGHCWFGNPECYLGESTEDIDASDHMLEFLLRFQLPGEAPRPSAAQSPEPPPTRCARPTGAGGAANQSGAENEPDPENEPDAENR